MINIYADESCNDAQRYLILGGIAVETAEIENVNQLLIAQREKYNTHGEVKWTKVSKSKFEFYKSYVDTFFDLNAKDIVHFHSLYVDTHTVNNSKWNQGSQEIGFNKLIYQLLLHKFGRRYGEKYRLYVHLDERTTSHNPNTLTSMLNSGLAKDWGVKSKPFKRITFQNSKTSEIIQLNDLLIGAIGFRKNGHHQKQGAATHKIELALHIASNVAKIEQPGKVTSQEATRFSIWPFEYKKKRVLGT